MRRPSETAPVNNVVGDLRKNGRYIIDEYSTLDAADSNENASNADNTEAMYSRQSSIFYNSGIDTHSSWEHHGKKLARTRFIVVVHFGDIESQGVANRLCSLINRNVEYVEGQ